MRSDCFIGTKVAAPSVLWLVNRRYHWQWVANGGRALRDADPSVDGSTDRWVSLRKARDAVACGSGAEADTFAAATDPQPVTRKRGRPRKDS